MRFWLDYATDHIYSAALFARKAGELERSEEPVVPQLFKDHRAYVTATIFGSVAFLEANINEFAVAAREIPLGPGAPEIHFAGGGRLRKRPREALVRLWPYVTRLPLLDKYDAVLNMVEAKTFDRGHNPAQDGTLLIRLRNTLVHFEPQWEEVGTTTREVAKQLQKKGLPENALAPRAGLYFPNRCLGHGLAVWGVTTALDLADEFYRRVGLPAIYEPMRDQLGVS